MLEVDNLGDLIIDTFINLIDQGFSIEVLHQNGNATYQIYNPEINLWSKSSEFTTGSYLNLNYELFESERFKNEMSIYIETINYLNEELFYIRDRIINIAGLKKFQLIPPARIEISIDHINQGFNNLGGKFLTGSNNNPVYYA